MKALVTGANGFVGSHLVRRLLREGWGVRAMVRRTSDLGLLEGTQPEWAYGDVTRRETLDAAVDGVDVVFHVAGCIATLDPIGFDRINRGGTVNLIDAIAKLERPPRRFLLVSSIAAAGPSRGAVARTEDDPPEPLTKYGESKIAAERELPSIRKETTWTAVRPPIVFGSGDAATLDFFRSVRWRAMIDFGGEARPMSFIHVSDLIEAIIAAGTRDEAAGEVFYTVGPETGTVRSLQEAIARAMGRRAVAIRIPQAILPAAGAMADRVQRWTGRAKPFGSEKVREALAPGWVCSGEKARRLLGFSGRIGLDEGAREALDWYRAKGWV